MANLLEIIVDEDRQLTIKSPSGAAESGMLLDISQVLSNLARQAPVSLPENLNGQQMRDVTPEKIQA
jgi:hypothetical protein